MLRWEASDEAHARAGLQVHRHRQLYYDTILLLLLKTVTLSSSFFKFELKPSGFTSSPRGPGGVRTRLLGLLP
jgi:hypothetical protein